MRHARHVARTLSDDAWQITDAEGQHTARVVGTEREAIARAHHQLDAYGGGRVFLTDAEQPPNTTGRTRESHAWA